MTELRYQFLDDIGKAYGLNRFQAQTITKRHNLRRTRIYGLIAIDAEGFEQAAEAEGHKLLPGWQKVQETT